MEQPCGVCACSAAWQAPKPCHNVDLRQHTCVRTGIQGLGQVPGAETKAVEAKVNIAHKGVLRADDVVLLHSPKNVIRAQAARSWRLRLLFGLTALPVGSTC